MSGSIFFDPNILVATDGRGRCCRVGGIFPVEHHIVGGELSAVVPLDASFESPGHRHAVRRDPTVLDFRYLCGEHRHQVAVGVPCRKRLVENTGAMLVLPAHREMRIEQGRRLPEQHFERSPAAGFGRLVIDHSWRLRYAGMG